MIPESCISARDAIEEICNIIGGRMLPAALTAVLSVIYLFQISWFAGELMIPSVVILFIQLCNIAVAGILQIRLRDRENEAQTKVTGISYQLIRGICKIKIAGAQEPAFQVWASVWKHMPVMGNAWILLSAGDRKGDSTWRKHGSVLVCLEEWTFDLGLYCLSDRIFFLFRVCFNACGLWPAARLSRSGGQNASPGAFGRAGAL